MRLSPVDFPRSLFAAGAILGAATACEPPAEPDLDIPAPVVIEVPAGADAALPHVSEAGSGAILSWVEPDSAGHVLRFARWDGAAWSEPGVVARGDGWFVNWADFPSVIALDDNHLAGHWLQRSGAGTYAYDVMLSRSSDGGSTWSQPIRPHADATPTEHGFVSMFPVEAGLGVVWLDGRRFAADGDAPATNEMTLRYSAFGADTGSVETVLDDRACDCCQTAAAMTARGPLVAYRDRTDGEIRDIAVTRLVDGEWTEPRTVHADDWHIDACPVNGPQADAQGDDVVLAWFTAAQDTPRVHVAFSRNAGETFDVPMRIDGGDPLGRVDVLLLDDARALVVWLERTAEGASVNGRIVTHDGRSGATLAIAQTLAQRPSGFPRMARYAGGVLLAWTEPGDTSRVRAATLDTMQR
jgi:hypothetical protein